MRAHIKPVIESLQRSYPKQLADSKWDNTGSLVDSVVPHSDGIKAKVLLTIDSTTSVCEEALAQNTDLIIAYHPFIFGGIKAITRTNPQHVSLMKSIGAGVSVYSPHTAIDASPHGNADWLADGVTDFKKNEASRSTVQVIQPPIDEQRDAGYGRVVESKKPVALMDMVRKVKEFLELDTVQSIQAPKHNDEPITSVATCAGSGNSVLRGVNADLWSTGELSHHEMSYLKESGISAIVCGHSNTERGFLKVLRKRLIADLNASGNDAEIDISHTDADPIQYV